MRGACVVSLALIARPTRTLGHTRLYHRVSRGGATMAATSEKGGCCAPTAAEETSCCDSGDTSTPLQEGEAVRTAVRAAYAVTAQGGPSVLPGDVGDVAKRRELLGYTQDFELSDDADLGLGCGNPLIAAKLAEGEVVLDLGSGAGVDCFAAANLVGPGGRVIGVDMTPEMIDKSRGLTRAFETKKPTHAGVVSFRLGEIEHLPCGDGVVDCVISNCVINLSLDKPRVYKEMARVLKPGGRVSISDVLRQNEIPAELRSQESYSC